METFLEGWEGVIFGMMILDWRVGKIDLPEYWCQVHFGKGTKRKERTLNKLLRSHHPNLSRNSPWKKPKGGGVGSWVERCTDSP